MKIAARAITTPAAVEGSGMNNLCHIAEDATTFRQQVKYLFDADFSGNEVVQRQQLLQSVYDNKKNALRLMSWIY